MNKSAIFTALFFFVSNIYGQTIDSSFGLNGYLPINGSFANNYNNRGVSNNTVIQADGKYVTSIDPNNPNSTDLFYYTYRYNSDGSPDLSFGTNGVSSIFAGDKSKNKQVELLPDGKILTIGQTEYCINGVCGAPQFIMMRLNPNGSLDSSFGANGKILTSHLFGNSGTFAKPVAMQLAANGKIIVGGSNGAGKPFIARLKSNGFADSSFAINGIYIDTAFGISFKGLALNNAEEVFMLGTKINYTAGIGYDTTNIQDIVVGKLTSSGIVDFNFANQGRIIYSVSNDDEARSMAILPNQNLCIVGDYMYNNSMDNNWNGTGSNGYGITNRGFITFINSNGTMSSNLPNGTSTISLPLDSVSLLYKVLPVANDKLLIGGINLAKQNSGNYFSQSLIALVDQNGNFINTFGTNGYLKLDYGVLSSTGWQGKYTYVYDLDVLNNNDIIASGSRNATGGSTASSVFMIKLKNNILGSPSSISFGLHDDYLHCFPNPATDFCTINNVKPGSTLAIYSISGNLVHHEVAHQSSIQITTTQFAHGYYTVKVNDGKRLRTLKFYKE
jgi:uncharacterized delta-60 repeat protein